jgi:predicted Zn-dependent peptidase
MIGRPGLAAVAAAVVLAAGAARAAEAGSCPPVVSWLPAPAGGDGTRPALAHPIDGRGARLPFRAGSALDAGARAGSSGIVISSMPGCTPPCGRTASGSSPMVVSPRAPRGRVVEIFGPEPAAGRPAPAGPRPPAPASQAPAQTRPPARPDAIPAHPRELVFPPLEYTPPQAAAFRHTLANGVVAFLVEDHDLPLVTLTIHIRGGSYLDPKGKEGLAAMTGSQMRAGGTASMTADAFDEEVDFLAANVSSSFGLTSGSASVNFLAKDMDRALALFLEMIRHPRFQPDRLALLKTQQLQAMERRNDSTEDIEAREWARLLRGPDHFSTAAPTKASVEAVTRDDLVAFHRAYVHPANFVVAASGDFRAADLKARLERAMADWPTGPPAPPVPKPAHVPVPGVYLVDKPDVNQGRVTIGHLGIERGHPDEIAVQVMNEILGGGAFTSRIMARVRSDEGLAYSAGSRFVPGVHYPGLFAASFQSRSAACARAAAIVVEEIARIRDVPVSAAELETAKNYLIEVFPRTFASAAAIANTFASDELTGRDPAYWTTYRDRVRAVTVEDVQRVARQHLDPAKLVILGVGNVADMLRGDPDHPAFSFEKLAGGAPIRRIPLPDPLTMVYPAADR